MQKGTKERENEEETERGKENTWQPVTMQIHFKALLQKVVSDSECRREMGFWEVTWKRNLHL